MLFNLDKLKSSFCLFGCVGKLLAFFINLSEFIIIPWLSRPLLYLLPQLLKGRCLLNTSYGLLESLVLPHDNSADGFLRNTVRCSHRLLRNSNEAMFTLESPDKNIEEVNE